MTVLKMDDMVHCDFESKPASLFENIPHSQILFLFSPDEIREESENKDGKKSKCESLRKVSPNKVFFLKKD